MNQWRNKKPDTLKTVKQQTPYKTELHCFHKFAVTSSVQDVLGLIPGSMRKNCEMIRIVCLMSENWINKKVFIFYNSPRVKEIHDIFEEGIFDIWGKMFKWYFDIKPKLPTYLQIKQNSGRESEVTANWSRSQRSLVTL